MTLFEQMSDELLQEELLNEIRIDNLLKLVTNPEKISQYLPRIKEGNVKMAGPRKVVDMKDIEMSRPQVDASLIQNKVYRAAKASDINGNINVILNYYCPEATS